MLGGWIFDHWGGQTNFVVTACFLFFAAFLVSTFIKEPQRVQNSPSAQKKFSFLPDFGVLKLHSSLPFIMGAMFVSQIAFALVQTQLTLFIKELTGSYQNIGSITGMIFASGAVAAALGAIFFGWLSKKISLPMCFVISLSAAALGYLPQAFSQHWQFLLVIKVIDGFFIGGLMPVFNAALNILAPEEQRGSIFGISSSLTCFGAALGPVFGSAIAVSFGVLGNRAIFVVGSALLCGILLFSYRHRALVTQLNDEIVAKKLLASAEKETSEI